MSATTDYRPLTMFRVSWEWPTEEARAAARARVPVVMSRVIQFRARRGVWDCLPLDTFEDLAAAAREGWHPTPEAAIESEIQREQEERDTAERRIKALVVEATRRAKGRAK